jgi:DNA mismatch repair ATPase MutL
MYKYIVKAAAAVNIKTEVCDEVHEAINDQSKAPTIEKHAQRRSHHNPYRDEGPNERTQNVDERSQRGNKSKNALSSSDHSSAEPLESQPQTRTSKTRSHPGSHNGQYEEEHTNDEYLSSHHEENPNGY